MKRSLRIIAMLGIVSVASAVRAEVSSNALAVVGTTITDASNQPAAVRSIPVPEPTTLAMIGLSALGMLRRATHEVVPV